MEMENGSILNEEDTIKKQQKQPTIITHPPRNPILSILAIWVWLSGFYVSGLLLPLALLFLTIRWSLTLLAFFVLLMFIPLYENSKIASAVRRFICKYGPSYFPITMVVEDIDAFDPHQAYVLVGEPHSVLPLGLVAFYTEAGYLPLAKVKGLASSAAFIQPITRHIWTWLGIRPATMKNFLHYLRTGNSCILIPGGVREVFYMENGREVVYLKKRSGFIRAAIFTGSPLVPAFVFGQTRTFSWYKPEGRWYDRLCRMVKFTPMVFWGMFGTPIPHRTPMYLVVGKPIPVQMNAEPSAEEIEEVKSKFISALQELYERHKADAGYKDTPLFVY